MKDAHDQSTSEIFPHRKKPGPKPSGRALTASQRQKRYRDAQKARIDELEQRLRAAEGQIAFIQRIDIYEDR